MTELGIKEPKTLKELLEFLSKLEESSVKTKVIKKLREEVQQYITRSLDDFADEGAESGYLYMTIEKCQELRNGIVKEEKHEEYKKYNNFNENNDEYTELLINNILALFGCLYYMYYECASECGTIEGGNWWDEKCDETSKRDKKHLNNWLQDKTGDHKHMISRGFQQGDLGPKTGNDLFPSGSSTDALLHYREGAQVQYCLFYMLFLPKDGRWNDAQSGHAVLFLKEFCQKVSENKFNSQYTAADDTFSSACKSVAENINKLLQLQFIVPVAVTSDVSYENLLEARHFWSYISWLKENVTRLQASLLLMEKDAKNWEKTALKESKTFGPYPWGFTFRINWESKNKEQLKDPLHNLSSSLSGLKNALNSISMAKSVSKSGTEESSNSTAPTTSTDSTASTVGSVIGGVGAAAATAGAAYAGSSFLGPVAEGIGRFFKGLFL